MESSELPRTLHPLTGPLPASLAQGSVDGLGPAAAPARALIERKVLPADVFAGMTLYLLTQQPRRSARDGPKRGAVEGGVWVREQVSCHRPMRLDEVVTVSGESLARFTRRGRRYGVTRSETRGTDGRRVASNLTTGLLSYRKQPELEDQHLGVPEGELPLPKPDPEPASENPCLDRLRVVRSGEVLDGESILVTLELMRLRDAGRDHNPIHTDPTIAAREGLAAPIAGGSHVLAFLQARLMAEWGPECLLYGAHFDVRWVGQTYAETRIRPRITVVEASRQELRCQLEVVGEERPLLHGELRLPLA
ncbi:MAG: MaoC family dehydratase [Myxococcota bacterium]|nr:MaoC family dehydratase [Myxococcota bacterium]